ncbi:MULTISPECIES: MFS transporter [Streptomyces]|uniref:MFS transporter n=1 Tax=Streptomyces flaveolus TaxID=67297 RepID=A0ABV3AD62_9ACTN
MTVFRDRDFLLFWSARSVSVLGTTVSTVTLPVLVFRETGSTLAVAALGVLEVVPYLVCGAFAGAVGDRADRRRLMVRCDLLAAAGMAVIPLCGAFGLVAAPVVYAAMAIVSTAGVWFDAGSFGALPALAGRDGAVQATRLVWATNQTVSVVGAAGGALLIAAVGPERALVVDTLSFLTSALLIARIRNPLAPPRRTGAATDPGAGRVSHDIQAGVRFLWRQRRLRTLVTVGMGNAFSGGALSGLVVVFAVRALGVPEDSSRIGLLYTAGAAGAVAGSLLAIGLRNLPERLLTVAPPVLAAGLMLALAASSRYLVGLALYLPWYACYTFTMVNGAALRQPLIPDEFQSRVNMVARMLVWGCVPLGTVTAGLVEGATSIRTALALCTLPVAAAAFYQGSSGRPRIRKPTPTYDCPNDTASSPTKSPDDQRS